MLVAFVVDKCRYDKGPMILLWRPPLLLPISSPSRLDPRLYL